MWQVEKKSELRDALMHTPPMQRNGSVTLDSTRLSTGWMSGVERKACTKGFGDSAEWQKYNDSVHPSSDESSSLNRRSYCCTKNAAQPAM
jgi:hypothetical protein